MSSRYNLYSHTTVVILKPLRIRLEMCELNKIATIKLDTTTRTVAQSL